MAEKEWVRGSPVEVYSNSLSKWCHGEIVNITEDAEGTCIELRYWDGAVSKAKFLDPTSPHLRAVNNPQGETRFSWKEGSRMSCWSNSRAQWFEAQVVGVKEEKDGEWLQLSWEVEENNTKSCMTKEVLRNSLFIRPHYTSKKANDKPKGKITKKGEVEFEKREIIPVEIEVGMKNRNSHDAMDSEDDNNDGVQGEEDDDPGAEEDQVDEKDVSFEREQPGSHENKPQDRFTTHTITSEMHEQILNGGLEEPGEHDDFEFEDWELEREEYEFKFEQLQHDLDRVKADMVDERTDKDGEIFRLKKENDGLLDKVRELEDTIQKLKLTARPPSPKESREEKQVLTEEIDRLSRELVTSNQKLADVEGRNESLTRKLEDNHEEIKELTATFKQQILRLEHEKKKQKKRLDQERQSRLTANAQLVEKEQAFEKLQSKLRSQRRQNCLLADSVHKLRSQASLRSTNDDGSAVGSSSKPSIARRRRKTSGGDSPLSQASQRSDNMTDLMDTITSMETIMSGLSYSDEEESPRQTMSRNSLPHKLTFDRVSPKSINSVHSSRSATPQRPYRRNGYHSKAPSGTFEPAEVPSHRSNVSSGSFPFSGYSEVCAQLGSVAGADLICRQPPSYSLAEDLDDDDDDDDPEADVLAGLPNVIPFQTATPTAEQLFTSSIDSDDAFRTPVRPRERSWAVSTARFRGSPPDARASIEVDRTDLMHLENHHHRREFSESYPSSDFTVIDPSTPATPATTVEHSPLRRDVTQRIDRFERGSIGSPVTDTTVGSNWIIDTFNVKWPRRKKSLVLSRTRNYETTRVSLRHDGMSIEHYASKKEEPKFWTWDEVLEVKQDSSQLLVRFAEGEYIKMKLLSTDQAESWYHLLQERRRGH